MGNNAAMDKHFDPASYERKWQKYWVDNELYTCPETSDRPGFCIMIPPPNVTGTLHLGHALQSALQDLLVRWRRMQGYNALWLPGTDHAGIATQLMVERQLKTEGTSRQEVGRDAFVERVWEWKHEHHGHIRNQLELLGTSCDWTRERFTMDEGLCRAVREAFVRYYREGKLYRGEYLVNWSPQLQTAVSDLEVEMKEVQGKLYHVAYPIEGSDERIVVATTRPETMLGDTGIALHPEDERYQHLLDKHAVLPLVGRKLRFIADDVVDPEFGTGLVKVTPFHDPNDFEMGQRHGLERVQVIGLDGHMTEAAGEFAGLDRFEARKQVVEALRDQGYLVKVEDHVHNVGHSQRGGEPIEPLVSTQWFCDVSEPSKLALEAVQKGDLQLVPATHAKTWEHWLSNIRPWCVSRQLWWGHRIPAWYNEDGDIFVAHSFEEAAEQAGTDQLTQDPDVLDTWFSSALWPFSTLGWPDDTPDMQSFYPTDVLITGHDILFFWVARMVFSGYQFTGKLPFHSVHLTGLVRAADGQKMSKTKGNTIDPLELVDEHGADALRFTLSILDVPGRDIPLDPERMAGYRAFCNKIWNATRFALSKIDSANDDDSKSTAEIVVEPDAAFIGELAAPERWILSRLSRVAEEVSARLEAFRFDEACQALYHFFWGELCDWYIELCKPALGGEAPRPHVAQVLLTVLDRSLRLLHPVMPHLTEELWHRLPGYSAIDARSISLAPYPKREESWEDAGVEAKMAAVLEVIGRARAMRTEQNLPASTKVTLHAQAQDANLADFLHEQAALLRFLLRLESLELTPAPEGAVRDLVAGVEMALVAEVPEMTATERQRLEKDAAKLGEEIEKAEARLSNEHFLSKAPAQVVESQRQRLDEMKERRERILTSLES